jgi:hypothetical protein
MPIPRQRASNLTPDKAFFGLPAQAGAKDTLPPPPPYAPAGSTNIEVIPPPPTPIESIPPRQAPLPTQEATPPLRVETLTVGSAGTAVESLQQILRSYGYNVIVDGAYGPQTAQAVRSYQRDVGLPVTGTADYATLDSLGLSNTTAPYIAAIISGWDDLATVQQVFPYAQPARNRLGEFISIGQFRNRSEAEARIDLARQQGFRNTRVIHE